MRPLVDLKTNIKNEARDHNNADRLLRTKCLDHVGSTQSHCTALEKTMEYLRLYGASFEPYVSLDLKIAGSAGCFGLPKHRSGLRGDIGHYCANYATMLELGVDGLKAKLEATEPTDLRGAENRAAFQMQGYSATSLC